MKELIKIDEPTLLFGHNQAVEDPRDGLTLFGPLDKEKLYGIRAGLIGTKRGIQIYKKWVEHLQSPICDYDNDGNLKEHRPIFPGFEAAFRIQWTSTPILELLIPDGEIEKYVYYDDPHQRVFKTVDVYSEKILKAQQEEDVKPDIWFVIIPEIIYKNCRPKSTIDKEDRVIASEKMSVKRARRMEIERPLFAEEAEDAIPYLYELNFHNQLKARLLEKHILTQILRETTLAPEEFLNGAGNPIRRVDDPSTIAWNISTAVYYKVGGRPWKLNNIRDGVCYIGMVFKQDKTHLDPRTACCAAQMFLDSGDGVVFKGNVGPWYNPKFGDYHLHTKDAKELIGQALDAYKDKMGCYPKELFIHGKIEYDDDEWLGFQQAIDPNITKLVGVKIYNENHFKLFRKQTRPVLRGTAFIRLNRTAYLWTKGYIPRLQTYVGRAVPKPLTITICRGEAEIMTVLKDVLALTKLNYNTCIFADGQPVTLRFANAVGEILTAGPLKDIPPLPFKHYI